MAIQITYVGQKNGVFPAVYIFRSNFEISHIRVKASMFNRPFSYSTKEPGSSVIFVHC